VASLGDDGVFDMKENKNGTVIKIPVFRIAPSPTGEMHIGTVGMALCDYMLARTMGGKCLLRIEDTDQKREVKGAATRLIESFKKFGIRFDNEDNLTVQSTRGEIYKKYAEELVAKNLAYRDEGAIRFRAPEPKTTIKWHDLVKGEMALPSLERDPVILKSDGMPPYNLAATVDDCLMGVTHVLRGEEWLVSTAEHIQLRGAIFGKDANWQYAHMPVICIEEDGKKRKLSKRKDKEALAEHFLSIGYPIDAVIEYLLTLYNTDFEIWRASNPDTPWRDFKFRFEKIGSNSPLFDWAKLNDISKSIIAKKTCAQINAEVKEYFENVIARSEATHSTGSVQAPQSSLEDLDKIYKILAIDRGTDKPRKDIAKYSDIPIVFDYLFTAPESSSNDIAREYAKNYNHAANHDEWNTHIGKNKKQIRLALTGKESGPDLYAIMQIFGEQEVIKRLTR